jgi:hypothetical protein
MTATDAQMQAFADQRIRPFAEAARSLYLAAKDHKAAIDDVYARATSASGWADNRTDGPPHLLQSGNSANPDDVLNFNTFVTNLIAFVEGEASWTTLERACVRALAA